MAKTYTLVIHFNSRPLIVKEVEEDLKEHIIMKFKWKKRCLYEFSDATFVIDFKQVSHIEITEE